MPIYTWPGEQLPESLIGSSKIIFKCCYFSCVSPKQSNIEVLSYAEHYEQNADRYWDTFYKRNDDRFFSDRHYLQHEFPELTSGPITLFEVSYSPNDCA